MNFAEKLQAKYEAQAIHPRGRKYEREKPPKKGFSLPKGKTLKARLDWLSASVVDLITDYNFRPSTNKLLHEVQVHHSLITDSMPLEEKLRSTVKLAQLIPKLATDIQRLYAKGALPEDVDRKMIHQFLEEAKGVEENTEALMELLKEYEGFSKSLKNLGFKG